MIKTRWVKPNFFFKWLGGKKLFQLKSIQPILVQQEWNLQFWINFKEIFKKKIRDLKHLLKLFELYDDVIDDSVVDISMVDVSIVDDSEDT